MRTLTVRPEAPARAEVIENYLGDLDITPQSRDTYRRALKHFTGWIESTGIVSPTRQDILAYKDALRAEGLSPLTISGYMVAVRRFFEWLEGMKLYPNIARGIKGAKRPRGFRKDALTVEQVKAMLDAMDRDTTEAKRDFAIVNLKLRTGLREIELARADIGDIRQSGGEALLWIQGKGREVKDEFVLLTESTLAPIRDYLKARGEQGEALPLFASLSDRNAGGRLSTRSLRRIITKALDLIGIAGGRITPHSLRHTAITLSLLAGGSLQEAQSLARHRDINTTMIYAHNIDRIANAPERKIDKLLAG